MYIDEGALNLFETKKNLTILISIVVLREGTNFSYRNRGILTVGLKNETVEIVGIIFPHPLPQNLRFWE